MSGLDVNDDGDGGDRLVWLDQWATGVFVLVAILSAAVGRAFIPVNVSVSLLLFLGGIVAFSWGYAVAVGRSRHERIELSELFFVTGDVAPADVRLRLRASLVAQIAIAIVTAALRPYPGQAIAVIVPVFGLGIIALWSARYGSFEPREEGGADAPANAREPE